MIKEVMQTRVLNKTRLIQSNQNTTTLAMKFFTTNS